MTGDAIEGPVVVCGALNNAKMLSLLIMPLVLVGVEAANAVSKSLLKVVGALGASLTGSDGVLNRSCKGSVGSTCAD